MLENYSMFSLSILNVLVAKKTVYIKCLLKMLDQMIWEF